MRKLKFLLDPTFSYRLSVLVQHDWSEYTLFLLLLRPFPFNNFWVIRVKYPIKNIKGRPVVQVPTEGRAGQHEIILSLVDFGADKHWVIRFKIENDILDSISDATVSIDSKILSMVSLIWRHCIEMTSYLHYSWLNYILVWKSVFENSISICCRWWWEKFFIQSQSKNWKHHEF